MTMPMERTRALRFAHEVLTDVQSRDDVPANLRYQAKVTLRHFPAPHVIASMAAQPALRWWFAPEESSLAASDAIEEAAVARSSLQPDGDVWTMWLEHECDRDIVSRFVVIAYARDERLARALFAGRFGVEYAKLAQLQRGVVVNDVTEKLVSPGAFRAMDGFVHERKDFCAYMRLDHQ